MGFIISPWSLLLMPSGNISFTDEYVTQQDLRAFTAPEVLEGVSLSSVSDIEKVFKHLRDPCGDSISQFFTALRFYQHFPGLVVIFSLNVILKHKDIQNKCSLLLFPLSNSKVLNEWMYYVSVLSQFKINKTSCCREISSAVVQCIIIIRCLSSNLPFIFISTTVCLSCQTLTGTQMHTDINKTGKWYCRHLYSWHKQIPEVTRNKSQICIVYIHIC